MKAVAWLLQVEPTAAKTATTAQLLLHVPGVPLMMTEQLVAAGARVSFEQMCAAASEMIAGVELWVQACLNLDVTADIPSMAFIMCASDLVSLLLRQTMYQIVGCSVVCAGWTHMCCRTTAGLMLCSAVLLMLPWAGLGLSLHGR
jgi:hypothetical protein